MADNGNFLRPFTVQFTEPALVVTSSVARTEFGWEGFVARIDDKTNHYLFVDEAQAFVLPRLAAEPFKEQLERHTAHLQS